MYAHDLITTRVFDLPKKETQWLNPEYDDGWNEGERGLPESLEVILI